jgi:hypothetical protein
MIGAMRLTGWVTMGTWWKAANGERVVDWFRGRLAPKLRRGDVVVPRQAEGAQAPAA